MKFDLFGVATGLVLAGIKPGVAFAACVLITDPSALRPLDANRIVDKVPNGGSIITVTGCFIDPQAANLSITGESLCEGDIIAVDRQQCVVKSIQSTAVGQVGRPRLPAAPSGRVVPDVVPLLQKP
jgi:hypothetical protein